MKKLLCIFGILSILILSACAIQKNIVEPIKEIPINTSIQLSEKEQCEQQGKLWFQDLRGFECIEKTNQIITCEQGGGQWKMFNNGCVDGCGQKPRLCTQAFQAGCDCGATKCYGQEPSVLDVIRLKCINDSYEPYTTPQEACGKTNGNWTSSIIGGGCKTTEAGTICYEGRLVTRCLCTKDEIFYTDGCSQPRTDLMSIIAYK